MKKARIYAAIGAVLMSAMAVADEPNGVVGIREIPTESIPPSLLDAVKKYGADLLSQQPTLQQLGLQCPEEPNLLDVTVTSTVIKNTISGLYTYSYVVHSGTRSLQQIESFAVDFRGPEPTSMAPDGWVGAAYTERSTFGFISMSSDLFGSLLDTPTVLQSFVMPGSSLAGFSITSPNPPGPVRYFVGGRVRYPAGFAQNIDETEADALMGECPAYGQPFPAFNLSGTAVGPSNGNSLKLSVASRSEAAIALLLTVPARMDINLDTIRVTPGNHLIAPKSVQVGGVASDGAKSYVVTVATSELKQRCYQQALIVHAQSSSGAPLVGMIQAPARDCISIGAQ